MAFAPYREHWEISRRRTPLVLGFLARLRFRLGLTYGFHVVEEQGGRKTPVAGADNVKVALKILQRLTRERKGILVDDVLLWCLDHDWEYRFDGIAIDEIITNRCKICGSEFEEPCDAGLHS